MRFFCVSPPAVPRFAASGFPACPVVPSLTSAFHADTYTCANGLLLSTFGFASPAAI